MADYRIRISQGPAGPPGSGGGGGEGFSFWPRTLSTVLTVPDDHTLPVRSLVIEPGGEIIVGDGAEVLNL